MDDNVKTRQFLKPSFRFADKVVLEALAKALDSKQIDQILTQTGRVEQRKRMLPARLVVLLVVAMTLYAKESLPEILNILVEGLRFRGAYLLGKFLPVKSALTQARRRLGVKPMAALFHALVRPLVEAHHAWAFYKDMKLVAFDGTSVDVPDTPENERFFKRPGASRGKAAWPLTTLVGFMELGAKIILDAFVGPYKINERKAAVRMARSIQPGMLILWDRLFIGYWLWKVVLQKGAHLLGRLARDRIFQPIKHLPDGSYLARFYPNQKAREQAKGDWFLVRVIEYTIVDPDRPGFREKHRLITTLLDAKLYPARELAALYHERWEIELGFDEIKIHMMGKTPCLRSRTPLGCLQEIYGMLIAHLAIRSLMLEAANTQGLDPDRISFTDSIRIIHWAMVRMQAVRTELLPIYYGMMLDEIASHVLPPRRNRINPRVVKQKVSKFSCKRLEHYNFPQPQTRFHEAIHVLN